MKSHIVDGIVKDRIWYAFHRRNIKLPTMPWLQDDLIVTGGVQPYSMSYPDIRGFCSVET
jgi:hypothetical protein